MGLRSVFDESSQKAWFLRHFRHLSLYFNQFTLNLDKIYTRIVRMNHSIYWWKQHENSCSSFWVHREQTDRQTRRRTSFYNMYVYTISLFSILLRGTRGSPSSCSPLMWPNHLESYNIVSYKRIYTISLWKFIASQWKLADSVTLKKHDWSKNNYFIWDQGIDSGIYKILKNYILKSSLV